jgi:hypothetical protein
LQNQKAADAGGITMTAIQTREHTLREFLMRLPESEGAAVVRSAEANRGGSISIPRLDEGYLLLPGEITPRGVLPGSTYEGLQLYKGLYDRFAECGGNPEGNEYLNYKWYVVSLDSGEVRYEHLTDEQGLERLLTHTGCEVRMHES